MLEIDGKIVGCKVINKNGMIGTIVNVDDYIHVDYVNRVAMLKKDSFINGFIKFEDDSLQNEVENEIKKLSTEEEEKKEVKKVVLNKNSIEYVIKDDAITSFRGEYSFLSNMYCYKVNIKFNGYEYNAVDTAFQAQKKPGIEETFSKIIRPNFSKTRGKSIKGIRKDWEEVKDGIMEDLVRIKFTEDERLKNKLLDTGNRQLVECNDWGDMYWGVCNGCGLNKLGEILMKVREEIKNNIGK